MQLSKYPFPALGLGRHAQLDDFVGVALGAGSSGNRVFAFAQLQR